MAKYRFWTIVIIALAVWGGFSLWADKDKAANGFKLGLDLSGGTHLVYKADTALLAAEDVDPAMQSLRDTIERRVNLFGVSEPLVQVEQNGVFGEGEEQRLIVELPGVTDVDEAIRLIGETPILEFKLLSQENQEVFIDTGLTGRMLSKASIQFDQNFANQAIIGLKFNKEGADLFAKITRENIGSVLGIFLDGGLIQAPYIREEIGGGEAVITGDFTPEEAKVVVRNLNYGALPMPISLLGTETIGASLGENALVSAVKAALLGLAMVALFMILFYRLPGLVATFALSTYVILMLLLFKAIPVTLTAAGLAGFIISIGMAIDANVLVFARMREEFALGKNFDEAIKAAFAEAWTAIRDGNIASILGAIILFWFGTSAVEGFALTLGIGTAVSMFSALVVARTFLLSVGRFSNSALSRFLNLE